MGQNPNSIPSDKHFLLNHSPSPHSAPGDWRFLQEEELGKTFWNRRGLSLLRTDLVRYARPPWSGSRSRCELARRSCPGPRNDGPIYALMAYPTSLGSAGLSGAPHQVWIGAAAGHGSHDHAVRQHESSQLVRTEQGILIHGFSYSFYLVPHWNQLFLMSPLISSSVS